VVPPGHGDSLLLARAMARFEVTLLLAQPQVLQMLADEQRIGRLHLSGLEQIVVAGVADEALRERWWQRFGKELLGGWLDSRDGWLSLNLTDQLDGRYWFIQQGDRPGSLGQPLPGVALRSEKGVIEVAEADGEGVLHWRSTTIVGSIDDDGYVWPGAIKGNGNG